MKFNYIQCISLKRNSSTFKIKFLHFVKMTFFDWLYILFQLKLSLKSIYIAHNNKNKFKLFYVSLYIHQIKNQHKSKQQRTSNKELWDLRIILNLIFSAIWNCNPHNMDGNNNKSIYGYLNYTKKAPTFQWAQAMLGRFASF